VTTIAATTDAACCELFVQVRDPCEFPKSVILSEAKDLRRCLELNCHRLVFNDDMGENRESLSREIILPEVLRFAQDDRNTRMTETANWT
jgi:hypothetical protein